MPAALVNIMASIIILSCFSSLESAVSTVAVVETSPVGVLWSCLFRGDSSLNGAFELTADSGLSVSLVKSLLAFSDGKCVLRLIILPLSTRIYEIAYIAQSRIMCVLH